jgi:hypothetical protein
MGGYAGVDSAPSMPMGALRKEGMLSRLDDLLNQVSANIEILEGILQPIRSGPDSPERAMGQPQEAPANRLHELILRLEHIDLRVRTLHSELHL